MKTTLIGLALIGASFSSAAGTFSLEYGGFYDRLNGLKKAEVNMVEVAFYVRPRASASCELNQVNLVVKKQDTQRTELMIGPDNALLLPFDRQLKSDRALVELDLDGDESSCALAISVQSKPLINPSVDSVWLEQLYQQLDKVYAQYAGFPMKYFRPEAKGLTLLNSSDSDISIESRQRLLSLPAGGQLQLTKQELAEIKPFQVTPSKFKATAWY
ncbi:DUF2987 domain-containing protein [Paraferrimonas sedimenticola]|uniref:DUF2987 domain-containing protein n=1 Tax=Paraferrimonas sedimenticola TaxID=375674 RepID=A0AA37RV84_9GAMM|nr:DUF2987 domain-containing protein [Paraferrimonas sedimenticola]GLP96096.1 hypothetical protein GCM10007895_14020 [Paraferrimonas sedimenticola]